MPVLQAFNVSHQFDNGETLFQSISCSMTKRRGWFGWAQWHR